MTTAVDLGLLLLGAALGLGLDHLLSPPLSRWREQRAARRARRRSRTYDYAGRPLELDGVDVGLHVLFGSLGKATRRHDVTSTLLENRWTAPAELRDAARRYAELHRFFDGDVARLHELDVVPYSDRGAEHHRLHLTIAPTGFYDMLATNVALGPFTPSTAPLLTGRGGLAETQLSNMMGLDLTLVTTDGHVPVFLRSPKMAALENCWQTSSGETVQLEFDCDSDGNPDIFETARRGLHEELQIEAEQLGDLAVTAFVATPEYANVGVLMFGELRLTAAELEPRLNRHILTARDSWEYTEHSLLSIDDVQELARALTDPARRWSKQAAASLIFAHAYRANGNVEPLAAAIRAAGSLSLEPGPRRRGIIDEQPIPTHVRRYCWRCGSAVLRPPTTCEACGQDHYVNPKPCGAALVVRDREVLLVKRARPPWKDHWDVPGGFCEGHEHPMRAAERELHEELGLVGEAVAHLGTWMDTYGPPTPDGVQQHTANSVYLVELRDPRDEIVLQVSEIAEARWFPLDAPPAALAFPDHLRHVLSVAADPAARPAQPADLADRVW